MITGQQATDGAGVKLVRVIGYYDTAEFDPFLMLDAFDSTNPDDYIKGFPWHPHRGIETVTYLLSGTIEHGDNMGNKGVIMPGECQWMTAGSGIIHQEMPKPSERMLGTQLWLNLPAKDKMTHPAYRAITRDTIPVIKEKGTTVRIISGNYNGVKGATEGDYVNADYFDVAVAPDTQWNLTTDPDNTLFIYILSGSGLIDDTEIKHKQAVLFNTGEIFEVKATAPGLRFLLLSGKPLKEPIAWGGPIVMNTQKELDLAFEELENNTFIKTV
ncbi:MAG: pirin family protein [Fibrobacter sp.]|nr:pirin family protein [Fibrobacter sp.]